MTNWTEDQNLSFLLTFDNNDAIFDGKIVSFRENLDDEPLRCAQPLPPLNSEETEDDVLFAVMPTLSWNIVQKTIQNAVLNDHQRRCFTIGRAFSIPEKCVSIRKISSSRTLALLMLVFDCSNYDIATTIRFDGSIIDPQAYPFVVLTRHCLNNYLMRSGEFGLREIIRANRPKPKIMYLRKKDCCLLTIEKFNEWANPVSND